MRWLVVAVLGDGPQTVGIVEASDEDEALIEASWFLEEVLGIQIEEGLYWVKPCNGGDNDELLE